MGHNIDYTDKQPAYWQNNHQFASQLDSVYSQRAHGYRPQQDPRIQSYALPQSQKVALITVPGSLPKFTGQVQTTPRGFKNITSAPPELGSLNLENNYGGSGYGGGSGEIDAGQMLQQRIMQQQFQGGGGGPQNNYSQDHQQFSQHQQAQEVSLLDGYPFYRPLQVQGFGNVSMPVVRTAGNIAGTRGPVQLKNIVQVYVADGLNQINMARLHEDVARIKTMAIVQALWTNGEVLVPQEAIVHNGSPQQLLIDNRARQYQQQQQAPVNVGQQLLIQQQQQMAQQQRQMLLNHNIPQQPMTRQSSPQQRQQLMSPTDQSARELLRKRGLLRG